MDRTAERAPWSARLRDSIEAANTPFRLVQDAIRLPRSELRYRRKIEASLRRRPDVLLVYSATKTASTALADALAATDRFTVIKVHNLQREHFWPGSGFPMATPSGGLRHRAKEQFFARRFLRNFDGPVRVLSMARDPIAFNISNFTYFGRAYWLRTCWRSARWIPGPELGRLFMERFPHESSSVWWSRDFAPTIGFDPLSSAFDAERGWTRRTSGRFDSLVMRADLDDGAKASAVRDWLGLESLPQIGRVNENDAQAPPELAARLRAFVRTQPAYVDRMLALPASRHLWTDAQRDALRARWLA